MSQFQSIFRFPVGQRWRWRWRWRWKNFHGEMLRKWNGIVPTYVEAAKKILGNIPNVKFFRADTYFGGTQNLGQPEKHFFDTFFQFRPWRGPKCDQNQLLHVNIMGKLQLGKKIGEFWAPGAEIWLFKKKNMDRSIDLAVQHRVCNDSMFNIQMEVPVKPTLQDWNQAGIEEGGEETARLEGAIKIFCKLGISKNIQISCLW